MAKPSPVPAALTASDPDLEERRRAKAGGSFSPSVLKPSKVSPVSAPGPRKLIRPTLPPGATRGGRIPMLSTAVYRGRFEAMVPPTENSHAETFYLHKQVQTQTLMVFVLEGGERVEGYIEWYDRDAIKVRHRCRALIYKSSIKYLYKAADGAHL